MFDLREIEDAATARPTNTIRTFVLDDDAASLTARANAQRLYRARRVLFVHRFGTTGTATFYFQVLGDTRRVYDVILGRRDDGAIVGSCDCPYLSACEHLLAALWTWKERSW